MRISRAPSSTEGMTALHVAVQAGKTDLVRYLLDKGTNPEIVDSNGRKPIDLVGGGDARAEGARVPATAATPTRAGTPPDAGRGGNGGGGGNPTSAAEIRALLQSAASHK
jgi:hypothetical protein